MDLPESSTICFRPTAVSRVAFRSAHSARSTAVQYQGARASCLMKMKKTSTIRDTRYGQPSCRVFLRRGSSSLAMPFSPALAAYPSTWHSRPM